MNPDFDGGMRRCLSAIPQDRGATCAAIARALGDIRAAKAVAEWIRNHPTMPGAPGVVLADGRPVLEGVQAVPDREPTRTPRGKRWTAPLLNRLPPVHLLDDLRRQQAEMASRIVAEDDFGSVATITGVDAAYDDRRTYVAAVTCRVPDLEEVDSATRVVPTRFPYIPTYLAYRELPAIERVVRGLSRKVELLLVNGHGLLHPAGCGIASMAGVRLGLPTIGVARHLLVGRPATVPDDARGAFPLRLRGRTLGYAWTPPGKTRPVYVSVGHRVSASTALEFVRRATRDSLPEPLRRADRLAAKTKEEKGKRNGRP